MFSHKNKNYPIIIGGIHRSGTSLLRRILNSHSGIYCGPEVKFFKDWHNDYIFEDPIKHARFIASARTMLAENELLHILGKAFIEMHERAAQLANKRRWADKNPENVLYLDQWEKILGSKWYFIHVVRNPLDTLASIAEANFRYTIPSELDERIEFYIRYSEAGLRYYEAHPECSYRLIYEQLVVSPQKEIEQLMEWLGEKSESSQLNFNSHFHQIGLEDPKVKKTAEIHSRSVDRWEEEFTQEEIQKVLNKTTDLWKKLDYKNIYSLENVISNK